MILIMKDPKYDFDKETDRDFLREAGKMLQEKVIKLEIEVIQLKVQQSIDEDIKSKLAGELLVLRRRIFESKQEKKDKLKNLKAKKKKKNINLLHNQNENKNEIEIQNAQEIELETKEIEYGLDSCQCPHCDQGQLGELMNLFEESTEYDVNTTFYLLKRHKRKKYKCNNCKKLVTAPGGVKLSPGGQFSVQMAVQIACDKFEYHIPLERQRKKMYQAGLKLSVKTLFSLTQHLYNVLFELSEMNRQDIIIGKYICIDESPMPFFNPTKSTGYAWSVSNNIGAYYQFEPNRNKEVAQELVKDFSGIVMTDGYGAYGFLGSMEGIVHAYCWSHMRRYFFDAMKENEAAGAVVDFVDELYEIEHQAQDFEELKYLRQSKSSKIYNEIKKWIEENEGRYLSSNLTAKAITYFYNQKVGLEHFLTNEFIPLDNNAAERRQRCPVMGRKNFLAFKSIDGADIGMFFYSIIESCKSNGLNPSAYLFEMAIKKLKSEKIMTPYQYANHLKQEVINKLKMQLTEVSKNTS